MADDKVKLHRCKFRWLKVGMHPCHKVEKALQDQGVDYEVVTHGKDRSHIENLSGQRKLPVLELQDGEIYREESAEMAARVRAGAFGAL
jgi:glutaredoxin